MLTKVILEGAMGRKFGRNWEIEVSSPDEALRIIDANKPGVFAWIRDKLSKFSHYKVICKHENGSSEQLSEEEYGMMRKCSEIRFVPIITGAGGGFGQIIAGVALIAISMIPGMQPFALATKMLMGAGISMLMGGVVSLLSPRPKINSQSASTSVDRKDSHYFNGPENTTSQGNPVAINYGRCMVGSQAISVALTVDQLL